MSLFAPYLIINFDQAYLNIHSAIGVAHLSLVEFMLSIFTFTSDLIVVTIRQYKWTHVGLIRM